MKVKIIGHVNGGNLQGIVELDDLEALRLIRLKVAEPVDGNITVSSNTDIVSDHFKNVLKNQSETIDRLNSELDILKGINTNLKEENDSLRKQIETLQEKPSESEVQEKTQIESKKSGKK